MKKVLLVAFLILVVSSFCHAQAWSPFLDPSRAIDWTSAGFSIPSYAVACPTTVGTLGAGSGSAGSNATKIVTALNSCDATHNVVSIPAGTWYVAAITYPSHGKQVLRGAGANQTFLISTAQAGCEGFNAGICMIDATPTYTGSTEVLPGGTQACNSWSAGYSQGTTSITVTGCGGTPPNGGLIALDQADDSSDTGGVYVCDETTPASCNYDGTGGSVGRIISGVTHSQVQFTHITGVSSLGGGSYTVTISPGVYFTNVRSGQTPGAWWPTITQLDGIENLSVDGTADNFATVGMYDCYQCWAKNVTMLNGARDSIYMRQAAFDVIRDSYFYQAQGHASVSYNVEPSLASGFLIENNIMQQTTEPVMFNGGTGGVIDYNFGVDQIAFSNFTWGIFSGHSAGNTFNLFEGNNAPWDQEDDAWGSTTQTTDFRNFYRGWELGRTQASTPIIRRSYNRVDNLVGNILGQPSYHTGYQTIATSNTTVSGGSEDLNIYTLGTAFDTSCGTGTAQSSPFCDTLGVSTLMRWGNWDTVSNAVRWNSTEAAPGAFTYAPANFSVGYFNTLAQTLPASLYYSSTPSWWPSGKAWPPIGPDVSTGNVGICTGTYAGAQATLSAQCTGGTKSAAWGSHVVSIPAQDCYLITLNGPPDGTGAVLPFDYANCPSSSPTFTWTQTVSPGGSGTVTGTNSGSSSYSSGTTIGPLTANPASGYSFSSWSAVSGSAACSGATNPCASFSITANSAATANFTANSYTLSTATAGSGTGTITGCAGSQTFNTSYTCSVTPTGGSTLTSVSGCGGSGTTSYTGTMPANNCTVTATFTAATPTPTGSTLLLAFPGGL